MNGATIGALGVVGGVALVAILVLAYVQSTYARVIDERTTHDLTRMEDLFDRRLDEQRRGHEAELKRERDAHAATLDRLIVLEQEHRLDLRNEREQLARLDVTGRDPANYMAAARQDKTSAEDIGNADIHRAEVMGARLAGRTPRDPSPLLVDGEGRAVIPVGAE